MACDAAAAADPLDELLSALWVFAAVGRVADRGPLGSSAGRQQSVADIPSADSPGPDAAPDRRRTDPIRVACPLVRVGPAASDQVRSRCQRNSVAGAPRNADHRSRGNSLANTVSTSRSDGVHLGRATCRRNTISWCRRTAISTSFASTAGPIPSNPSTRRSSMNPTLPITPEDHAASAFALVSGVTHQLHPSRQQPQARESGGTDIGERPRGPRFTSPSRATSPICPYPTAPHFVSSSTVGQRSRSCAGCPCLTAGPDGRMKPCRLAFVHSGLAVHVGVQRSESRTARVVQDAASAGP
jgi:hypothetical protein